MQKFCFILLSTLLLNLSSSAQTDTTFIYFNKGGNLADKQNAERYYAVIKQGNIWAARQYKIKRNILERQGTYLDKELKKPEGSFKNFRDNGTLDYTEEYKNGEAKSKTYYYENSNKLASVIYGNKGIIEQKGWDKNGNEIKDYIVEKEAVFKGGPNGWKSYLEKNLNANVAAESGAPAGLYNVSVRFIVNKEGYISNVRADSIPAKCKPCAMEAVRVIRDGPQWENAVQNNRAVIYQAIQHVTFHVVEDQKKSRRS